MKPKRILNHFQRQFALLALLFIWGGFSTTEAQKKPKTQPTPQQPVTIAPPEISYTVSMPKPWTHLLEVEMRVKQNPLPEKTDLIMPVWTPGSYLIREYARHVQDFTAKNSDGNALNWQKINKNTWQIAAKGQTELVVNYRVYANELTVRSNELNDQHAFWNNSTLLMYPAGNLKTPSTLKVIPYSNWKVATGLPKIEGQPNTFRAENFDVLYDSPFEVGSFKEITFDVKGVLHRIVINGQGNYDPDKMRNDVKKVVETSIDIFGEIPYKEYVFILNLRGGGGLEHLNSTALQWNKFGFKPEGANIRFLGLVAHEYFHLWNVKRIRPDALGPFDYSNENYTKLLWLAEGGTDYYANLILRRAGFISDGQFLSEAASSIQDLQRQPGRFQTSLEEASFDAWIKYYRQDENAINNQISYYDKGSIVSMLFDIEIRKASKGAKSLDDLMRYLYTEFYKKDRNYTPQDVQKAAEMLAGVSLETFFSKYVRGRDEIDYNAVFNGIGLQLETGNPNASAQAYLGADTNAQGERLTVSIVAAGTPAYEQGLNTGDQIVAIDGFRANQQFLQSYFSNKKPGDQVRLTVFRFDELRDFNITLGARVPPSFRLVPVDNPGEEQKNLYMDWMGAELR